MHVIKNQQGDVRFSLDRIFGGFVIRQGESRVVAFNTDIPALCRALYEAAGIPWPGSENRPVHLGAEGPAVMTQSVGEDLSGLKAALEGLRDLTPVSSGGRSTDPYGFTLRTYRAVETVLSEGKSAGLLTDERPADPVEPLAVAMKALEQIHENAPRGSLAEAVAGDALAAIKVVAALKGRGE